MQHVPKRTKARGRDGGGEHATLGRTGNPSAPDSKLEAGGHRPTRDARRRRARAPPTCPFPLPGSQLDPFSSDDNILHLLWFESLELTTALHIYSNLPPYSLLSPTETHFAWNHLSMALSHRSESFSCPLGTFAVQHSNGGLWTSRALTRFGSET